MTSIPASLAKQRDELADKAAQNHQRVSFISMGKYRRFYEGYSTGFDACFSLLVEQGPEFDEQAVFDGTVTEIEKLADGGYRPGWNQIVKTALKVQFEQSRAQIAALQYNYAHAADNERIIRQRLEAATKQDAELQLENEKLRTAVQHSITLIDAERAENERLREQNAELLANIPKVPSEPNEKRLAKRVVELESECAKLRTERDELRELVDKIDSALRQDDDNMAAFDAGKLITDYRKARRK